MTYSFFIPIEPVAWERARACGRRFFTAPKSGAYKAGLRNFFDSLIWSAKIAKFDANEPLEMMMEFCVVRPAKCKRPYPSVRPDVDNYAKSVLDAMNEIILTDDGQVVELHLSKLYVDNVNLAGTLIKIAVKGKGTTHAVSS